MGGDTIKYLTCNSDAFRVTMVDKMWYLQSLSNKLFIFYACIHEKFWIAVSVALSE